MHQNYHACFQCGPKEYDIANLVTCLWEHLRHFREFRNSMETKYCDIATCKAPSAATRSCNSSPPTHPTGEVNSTSQVKEWTRCVISRLLKPCSATGSSEPPVSPSVRPSFKFLPVQHDQPPALPCSVLFVSAIVNSSAGTHKHSAAMEITEMAYTSSWRNWPERCQEQVQILT
jgi:hypothetical protein